MTNQLKAVLFPGQGSQEQGMGRNLAEAYSGAMELWKMAEAASGQPLREIFWDKDSAERDQTRYVQPAMSAVNLGLWFYHRSRINPGFLAGHSLGEFSALCAAGILEAEDTLKLTALRGRLMAEVDPDSTGGMAAVLKLDKDRVEELVAQVAGNNQVLLIANYNTPGQFVVSGEKKALKHLEPLIREAKGKMITLSVSGAFHSPMMREAAKELAGFMDRLNWKTPQTTLFFNSTADTEHNPEMIKKIMSDQMTSPVYFAQLIENMHEQGATDFVELGPKGVLTRMIPQILGRDADIKSRNISGPEY